MWQWLSDNASQLQALGTLLSVLIACVTVPVLVAAWRAASRAATAAQDQASAARKLIEVSEAQRIAAERGAIAAEQQVASAVAATAVSEQQLIAARDSAAAEREHSDLIRTQMLASLRPVLVFTRTANKGSDELALHNQSTGIASGIEASYGTLFDVKGPIGLSQTIVGPGSKAPISYLDFQRIKDENAFARYQSEDGRQFVTELRVDDAYTFIQKAYELP